MIIKHKLNNFGPSLNFDQDTVLYLDGETLTNLTFNITNVAPGDIKEVLEHLILVPTNASKMATFEQDEEVFVIFASNNYEVVGNYILSVIEEESDNWLKIE